MDRFGLRRTKGKSGDYEAVEILVNGRSLIDILREVELPFATREGHPEIAGSYEGVPAEIAFYPSRHLLDEPKPFLQGGEGRTIILECAECGEPGCWPFELRIRLDDQTVTWWDYLQPYRKGAWTYEALPEFVFDRRGYETELGWFIDLK